MQPTTSDTVAHHNPVSVCWVGGGLLILFLLMGMSGCTSGAGDKYPAAKYDAFLQEVIQASSSTGLVYNKDFWVEYGGDGNHNILRITLNTAGQGTPRDYKGLADLYANAYRKRLPDEKRVHIIIKDYQQMKTVYDDLYFW
jgi:hypothetical protein